MKRPYLFHRRPVLAAMGLLAALALPASAQTTVRFVPHADLQNLDPMGSTANIVKMHGFMVYDTLFGLDESFVPRPQMLQNFTVSPDGLVYRMVLRNGLKWHDGTPVTAEDCVTSLKRWMARDGAGQLMSRVLKEMRVVDNGVFELVFSRSYGITLESLSKVAANVPFMMPKRIAETDPFQQIPEPIGSGPFRFLRSEFSPGTKVVYEKFKDYVPRSEPASSLAGGKLVHVDRVEWPSMPDAQTAMLALTAGEVDIWESPLRDLEPVLKTAKGVVVQVTNKTGIQGQIYFNHVIPPFDNVKARQAMFWLTDQPSYLQVIVGNPDYYRTCASMFTCGTPMENAAGSEPLQKQNLDRARELFKESGWDFSKPIVVLDPVDEKVSHPAALVTVQALRRIGLTVDLQAVDWATALNRRNSREPTNKGGWNILHSYNSGVGMSTPVWSVAFSGACEKGLFGWPCDQELEDLRLEWALADGVPKKQDVARRYQARAFATGHHVPLGQWSPFIAYRDTISGTLPTHDITVFWNMRKGGK
jgi:peptide/nickel transport system substrate-binding protein